tara:strand:- start:7819 stop:8595 length:777 start_codon:yes stop_codon:yes gene_type:complete
MKISFSIITVTYNSKADLLKTISSVQSQVNKNFIHIIKDGLSQDKTNEIEFFKLRNTVFYESADNGVYDAMNKAFIYAKSEFIIFLNAGDIFLSKYSLKEITHHIKNNPNFNSYSGGTLQIDPIKKMPLRLIGIGRAYKYLPFAQLPHPSFIVKKSVLSKLKYPFDPKLEIASDYKQQLLFRKKGIWKTYYIDKIITVMPSGGISNKNKTSILKGYKETFLFTFSIYRFTSFYILLLKVLLNFYSKILINNYKYEIKY